MPRTTGAVILAISHGYTIDQKNDPLIQLADECLAEASLAFQPGSWAVDFIPFRTQLSMLLKITTLRTIFFSSAFPAGMATRHGI